MPNGGSEQASSLRKQDITSKLPSSTRQRFSSAATVASACPSFRIYYYDGAVGSVPFEWESHPGTPKHPSSGSDLPPPPPLTPPPSHFSFSGSQISRRSKYSTKKILALIPAKLFWLAGDHNSKVKKLSLSERVLIDDNDFDLFKFRTEKNGIRRFSSFDSSADYSIRRSHSTSSSSCFGIRRCFIC